MWTTLAAVVALATPSPAATPYKTITHQHVSPLCTGLRQNIGPAIRKVLQNDAAIAQSRPLLRNYAKGVATNSVGKDLQISRLERLISPLVNNTKAIEKLLNDPYVFPRVPISDSDRQLLEIRAYLQQVVEQQKSTLDVISGFVDTEQLGQLQLAGNEYARIANSKEVPGVQGGGRPQSAQAAGAAPTPPPSGILNAGVRPDQSHAVDPRFKETGSLLGNSAIDAFDNAIGQYQQQLQVSEGRTADLVVKALPLCGGQAPK